MRKLGRGLTFAVLLAILGGCNLLKALSPAQISFRNDTTDVTYYGVRLGSAEYDGAFVPGQTTGSYEVDAGSYTLQVIETAAGVWSPFGLSPFDVPAGVKWTMHFTAVTNPDGIETVTASWLTH